MFEVYKQEDPAVSSSLTSPDLPACPARYCRTGLSSLSPFVLRIYENIRKETCPELQKVVKCFSVYFVCVCGL